MPSRENDVLKEADNLRFQLGRVLEHAQILGNEMDAPVRLRRDLIAVEYESMQRFLKRYDEARAEADAAR